MSVDDANSSNATARYRLGVGLWVVFLAGVSSFGWMKSSENAGEWRAEREWHERHEQLMLDGQAEWSRLTANLQSLSKQSEPRAVLEKVLNDGQPLDIRREGTTETWDWKDPKYGFAMQFRFSDGEFRGWSGNWGTGQLTALYPQPPRLADKNTTEWMRRRIAIFGGWTWLAAFFASMIWPKRRWVAAQVMLAAALASGMAWLVNPGYSITPQGIFSNDNLFFAAIMLVVSVVYLALTSPVDLWAELELWSGQFGLRQLLLAVTAAAILLAMGPFGFVVFVAALVGCLLFGAIYYGRRVMARPAA